MPKLTKARRANLERLATYLEGLPADYAHFGMRQYLDERTHTGLVRYLRENGGVPSCGTVACALGHGPAAGILAPAKVISVFNDPTSPTWRAWELYAELFVDGGPGDALFEWCFGGAWDHTDNTHHGAAARIRYLLADQPVPLCFDALDADAGTVEAYAPYRIDAKQAQHA